MSRWYEQLTDDDDYWAETVKIDFAVALSRVMQKIGMNKSKLAKTIGSSSAYITKVLRGDSNLTIESMVKLARATGGQVEITIKRLDDAASDWSTELSRISLKSTPDVVVPDSRGHWLLKAANQQFSAASSVVQLQPGLALNTNLEAA